MSKNIQECVVDSSAIKEERSEWTGDESLMIGSTTLPEETIAPPIADSTNFADEDCKVESIPDDSQSDVDKGASDTPSTSVHTNIQTSQQGTVVIVGTAPIQSAIETLLENPSTLADKEQTETEAQVLPSIGLVNYETIKFPKCSAFESTHRREPQGIDDETANQSEPQGIDDETAHESDPQGIDEGNCEQLENVASADVLSNIEDRVPESPQNEEMPGDYTLSQLSLQPGAGDGESVNILDKVNQWLVGPDVADDGDFDDILHNDVPFRGGPEYIVRTESPNIETAISDLQPENTSPVLNAQVSIGTRRRIQTTILAVPERHSSSESRDQNDDLQRQDSLDKASSPEKWGHGTLLEHYPESHTHTDTADQHAAGKPIKPSHRTKDKLVKKKKKARKCSRNKKARTRIADSSSDDEDYTEVIIEKPQQPAASKAQTKSTASRRSSRKKPKLTYTLPSSDNENFSELTTEAQQSVKRTQESSRHKKPSTSVNASESDEDAVVVAKTKPREKTENKSRGRKSQKRKNNTTTSVSDSGSKRGRPPIDRQKYYDEFPDLCKEFYDTLTPNQFHCRMSRFRKLKQLQTQGGMATRLYLDKEAQRAKEGREKRKQVRAEKNPSQAKAVKKFNELKKLKKQKPVPETRPTNIKQSYVRQKTKTKCLASDVTVLGDKYDDCKTKLKKATKRIRELERKHDRLEENQKVLLEMNDHLKARVYGGRQCVAPTGTAVELMDNHEALRRVRDTNIDFLYVYPVLDFPEDFEEETGSQCEVLTDGEDKDKPFKGSNLYNILLKEPQTMRDLAPPPPDVLPKGYMGREPDSDESSVAGYQHSFIDDEGFENGNDGIGDVTIGHVRSLAYNGGNAHLPPIPPSVVKHISKRRADREELAKLCNGRIKLESEQIVTRLEKEIKREPVSI